MTLLDLREPVYLVPAARPAARVEARPRWLDRSLGTLTVGLDAIALLVAFTVGSVVRTTTMGATEGPTSLTVSLLHEAPYIVVFLLAMGAYGLRGRSVRRVRRSWFLDFGQLAHSLASATVATVAISAGMRRVAGLPKLGWFEAIAMAVPALTFVPAVRGIGTTLFRRSAVRSRVAVVGSSPEADRVVRRIRRVADLQFVGLITDIGIGTDQAGPVLGGIMDLPEICRRGDLDRVFVTSDGHDAERLNGILRRLPRGVQVSIVPTFSELLTWQSQVEDLDGMTIMEIPAAQLSLARRAAKRTLDVTCSALLLTLVAPVMLAIAVGVKLTSPGPVLFRQERIGHRGRSFNIVKFRTMRIGADQAKALLLAESDGDGPLFKMRLDPRITRFGRFLRQTSLDELPQLLNVLRGQMALVGPRPLIAEESACFDDWAARRFEVKPGMTGLWQVSGRSDLPFEELRQLDYAYAASWSLWWDLKILSQTPASVLRGRGAY